MLTDLLAALAGTKSSKEKERAYKDLERVGMDRRTADFLVAAERRKHHGRKNG